MEHENRHIEISQETLDRISVLFERKITTLDDLLGILAYYEGEDTWHDCNDCIMHKWCKSHREHGFCCDVILDYLRGEINIEENN